MSIALGESRRDVHAHPYFRGRAVCSRADVEIGCLLASQAPDSLGMLPSTIPLSGGRGANRASCVRLSLIRICQHANRKNGAGNDPGGGTERLQGDGSASPEIMVRSQAWTAPTTSSGPGTARGVAEPAIQSEITVMRARNRPSASIEARMTQILVRRADLASSGIYRSSGREHH